MKNINKLLFLGIFASLSPQLALAHGSAIDLAKDSAVVAIDLFKSTNSADTVKLFNGIKAWPSAGEIKVKIYLNNEANDTVRYTCGMQHFDDGTETVACALQAAE